MPQTLAPIHAKRPPRERLRSDEQSGSHDNDDAATVFSRLRKVGTRSGNAQPAGVCGAKSFCVGRTIRVPRKIKIGLRRTLLPRH